MWTESLLLPCWRRLRLGRQANQCFHLPCRQGRNKLAWSAQPLQAQAPQCTHPMLDLSWRASFAHAAQGQQAPNPAPAGTGTQPCGQVLQVTLTLNPGLDPSPPSPDAPAPSWAAPAAAPSAPARCGCCGRTAAGRSAGTQRIVVELVHAQRMQRAWLHASTGGQGVCVWGGVFERMRAEGCIKREHTHGECCSGDCCNQRWWAHMLPAHSWLMAGKSHGFLVPLSLPPSRWRSSHNRPRWHAAAWMPARRTRRSGSTSAGSEGVSGCKG